MRYITIILLIILLFVPSAFALYDQPYIEYDKDGITQINCIRCNTTLKTRNRFTSGFQIVSHIERIPFDLSDGTYTNLYFCRDCKREYQCTEEELAGMSAQFKLGLELEARAARKPKKHIDKVKKRYKNIKVKKSHEKGVRKK